MDDLLFHRFDLSAALRAQTQKLSEEIAALPRETLLGPEDVVLSLGTEHAVAELDLHIDRASVSHAETKVDVSQDQMRAVRDRSRPVYLPGTAVSFHVPFSGDPDLFYAKPDQFDFNPPRATIQGNELVFTFLVIGDDLAETRKTYDAALGKVQWYTDSVNRMVRVHNASLPAVIHQAVSTRRQRLQNADKALESLGLPVRGS